MVMRTASRLGAVALLACSACVGLGEVGAFVPPTVDEDPSLPQLSITVAGHTRRIHVETYGDAAKPPLLVLHGSLGDLRALRVFSALADEWFVILWDQRGNGLSERITADEYTFDGVVAEIDAVRAAFAGDRRVSLLGHSFGAMYASLYLSRRHDSIDRVVLLEPGGLDGDIFSQTFADIIVVDLWSDGLNEAFWSAETLSPGDHAQMDHAALRILADGHQTRYYCDPDAPPYYPVWRPGAYVEYLRGLRMSEHATGGATFAYDFAEGLRTVTTPVTIVAGECSALGPAYQARHHVPLFGRAQVVAIPNAGHRLFVEQPAVVLEAVRRGLAGP